MADHAVRIQHGHQDPHEMVPQHLRVCRVGEQEADEAVHEPAGVASAQLQAVSHHVNWMLRRKSTIKDHLSTFSLVVSTVLHGARPGTPVLKAPTLTRMHSSADHHFLLHLRIHAGVADGQHVTPCLQEPCRASKVLSNGLGG